MSDIASSAADSIVTATTHRAASIVTDEAAASTVVSLGHTAVVQQDVPIVGGAPVATAYTLTPPPPLPPPAAVAVTPVALPSVVAGGEGSSTAGTGELPSAPAPTPIVGAPAVNTTAVLNQLAAVDPAVLQQLLMQALAMQANAAGGHMPFPLSSVVTPVTGAASAAGSASPSSEGKKEKKEKKEKKDKTDKKEKKDKKEAKKSLSPNAAADEGARGAAASPANLDKTPSASHYKLELATPLNFDPATTPAAKSGANAGSGSDNTDAINVNTKLFLASPSPAPRQAEEGGRAVVARLIAGGHGEDSIPFALLAEYKKQIDEAATKKGEDDNNNNIKTNAKTDEGEKKKPKPKGKGKSSVPVPSSQADDGNDNADRVSSLGASSPPGCASTASVGTTAAGAGKASPAAGRGTKSVASSRSSKQPPGPPPGTKSIASFFGFKPKTEAEAPRTTVKGVHTAEGSDSIAPTAATANANQTATAPNNGASAALLSAKKKEEPLFQGFEEANRIVPTALRLWGPSRPQLAATHIYGGMPVHLKSLGAADAAADSSVLKKDGTVYHRLFETIEKPTAEGLWLDQPSVSHATGAPRPTIVPTNATMLERLLRCRLRKTTAAEIEASEQSVATCKKSDDVVELVIVTGGGEANNVEKKNSVSVAESAGVPPTVEGKTNFSSLPSRDAESSIVEVDGPSSNGNQKAVIEGDGVEVVAVIPQLSASRGPSTSRRPSLAPTGQSRAQSLLPKGTLNSAHPPPLVIMPSQSLSFSGGGASSSAELYVGIEPLGALAGDTTNGEFFFPADAVRRFVDVRTDPNAYLVMPEEEIAPTRRAMLEAAEEAAQKTATLGHTAHATAKTTPDAAATSFSTPFLVDKETSRMYVHTELSNAGPPPLPPQITSSSASNTPRLSAAVAAARSASKSSSSVPFPPTLLPLSNIAGASNENDATNPPKNSTTLSALATHDEYLGDKRRIESAASRGVDPKLVERKLRVLRALEAKECEALAAEAARIASSPTTGSGSSFNPRVTIENCGLFPRRAIYGEFCGEVLFSGFYGLSHDPFEARPAFFGTHNNPALPPLPPPTTITTTAASAALNQPLVDQREELAAGNAQLTAIQFANDDDNAIADPSAVILFGGSQQQQQKKASSSLAEENANAEVEGLNKDSPIFSSTKDIAVGTNASTNAVDAVQCVRQFARFPHAEDIGQLNGVDYDEQSLEEWDSDYEGGDAEDLRGDDWSEDDEYDEDDDEDALERQKDEEFTRTDGGLEDEAFVDSDDEYAVAHERERQQRRSRIFKLNCLTAVSCGPFGHLDLPSHPFHHRYDFIDQVSYINPSNRFQHLNVKEFNQLRLEALQREERKAAFAAFRAKTQQRIRAERAAAKTAAAEEEANKQQAEETTTKLLANGTATATAAEAGAAANDSTAAVTAVKDNGNEGQQTPAPLVEIDFNISDEEMAVAIAHATATTFTFTPTITELPEPEQLPFTRCNKNAMMPNLSEMYELLMERLLVQHNVVDKAVIADLRAEQQLPNNKNMKNGNEEGSPSQHLADVTSEIADGKEEALRHLQMLKNRLPVSPEHIAAMGKLCEEIKPISHKMFGEAVVARQICLGVSKGAISEAIPQHFIKPITLGHYVARGSLTAEQVAAEEAAIAAREQKKEERKKQTEGPPASDTAKVASTSASAVTGSSVVVVGQKRTRTAAGATPTAAVASLTAPEDGSAANNKPAAVVPRKKSAPTPASTPQQSTAASSMMITAVVTRKKVTPSSAASTAVSYSKFDLSAMPILNADDTAATTTAAEAEQAPPAQATRAATKAKSTSRSPPPSPAPVKRGEMEKENALAAQERANLSGTPRRRAGSGGSLVRTRRSHAAEAAAAAVFSGATASPASTASVTVLSTVNTHVSVSGKDHASEEEPKSKVLVAEEVEPTVAAGAVAVVSGEEQKTTVPSTPPIKNTNTKKASSQSSSIAPSSSQPFTFSYLEDDSAAEINTNNDTGTTKEKAASHEEGATTGNGKLVAADTKAEAATDDEIGRTIGKKRSRSPTAAEAETEGRS